MADIDIKYKGSTIGSLSVSGGKKTCTTSGRYCEDDIVIQGNLSDYNGSSVNNPNVIDTTTSNGASASDIVSGKVAFVNGVGIVGEASKRSKSWELNIASALTTTTTLISNDADVAAHYADDSACLTARFVGGTPPAANINLTFLVGQNTPIGGSYYQSRNQYSSGWGWAYGSFPIKSTTRQDHNIYADSSGNIIAVLNGRPMITGKWIITFSW